MPRPSPNYSHRVSADRVPCTVETHPDEPSCSKAPAVSPPAAGELAAVVPVHRLRTSRRRPATPVGTGQRRACCAGCGAKGLCGTGRGGFGGAGWEADRVLDRVVEGLGVAPAQLRLCRKHVVGLVSW